MREREKQNVTTSPTYDTALNKNDIRTLNSDDAEGGDSEQISSFKLLNVLLADWWKSSNSAEHHLKAIRRKVIYMLSKCIWSMKIIRIIFRLMSNNLINIDHFVCDRSTTNVTCIDTTFQQAIQTSINNYLLTECQRIEKSKWMIWSNENDIIVGHNWYSRKMLVVETLLTLKLLPDVIAERTGKNTIEK